MELIQSIMEIFANYSLAAEVIVASVRHPVHVTEAALAGADIATIPLKVIMQMLEHPLTDIGIKKFLSDWEKVPG
jgi:transaldolase